MNPVPKNYSDEESSRHFSLPVDNRSISTHRSTPTAHNINEDHPTMASTTKREPQAAGLKDDGSVPEPNKSADSRYCFDAKKLQDLRSGAPWTKDPKYFKACSISPSAVMKMMMHCQSGVKKGIDKGGNPIEVMGLLMGRPDSDTPKTLVITDAFPLPIEGFETRVIADDANVVNHMIALGECLEQTRKEKFMGWYVCFVVMIFVCGAYRRLSRGLYLTMH